MRDLVQDVQLGLPMDATKEGEIVTFQFVLPFLPPSKNSYDGWPPAWKSSAKKKWIRHVARKCIEIGVPQGLPQIGVAVRLVFASRQRRDPQNYAQALWNWVPDALVQAGVLVDDDEGRVEIGPNWGIEMAVDSRGGLHAKEKQRTVITLAARIPEDGHA